MDRVSGANVGVGVVFEEAPGTGGVEGLCWKPSPAQHKLHLKLRGANKKGGTIIAGKTFMFGHTQLAPVGRGTGRVSTEQSASFKVAPRRQQVQGPWVCCAGIRRGGCETSLESDASPLTSTFIRRGLPC